MCLKLSLPFTTNCSLQVGQGLSGSTGEEVVDGNIQHKVYVCVEFC